MYSYRGLLPGPGTGTFLPSTDRILFPGHYLTSYREGGAVVVYYSDDGGETYKLSNSTFPRADEASLTALDDKNLVVNQRLSVDVITMFLKDFMCTQYSQRNVKIANMAVIVEGNPSPPTPA